MNSFDCNTVKQHCFVREIDGTGRSIINFIGYPEATEAVVVRRGGLRAVKSVEGDVSPGKMKQVISTICRAHHPAVVFSL